jgi:hypothetical protein
MTTPITKQKKSKAVPAPAARRDWCCGTPITGPHTEGCAYEPRPDEAVDYDGPVEVAEPEPEAVPEPPPTPPTEVPAAASPRSYGITKLEEADLELPSGSFVRYRKLTKSHLLKLNLVEVMDGFTPELLADMRSDDEATVNDAAMKALTDPERNGKIFGPVDRVVVASVTIPTVVLAGPTTDSQVNIDDVELEDKLAIFGAAIGEQLDALKSVRDESPSGV